ncbi:MAG: hypothetical protein B7Z66_11390 [Chromatiales bacterium 21-64-14]|nr:MAG: hypothetical protein B7Z66_11390 [Chromatiales bacterium 21-64-14]
MSADHEAQLQALLSLDPGHIYSDDELDAIEALDPALALRIDRVQTLAQREGPVAAAGPVEPDQVAAAVEEARCILMQDGGDIELVAVEGSVVRVRMKGACVGCPRSVLDLRNVVERLVKRRSPGVTEVVNVF